MNRAQDRWDADEARYKAGRDTAPAPDTAMYRASLETRNFSFEAYGKTEQEAHNALHEGFVVHCRERRVPVDQFTQDYADDIEVRPIALGAAYRDGEQIAFAP
jgi:hypothetical protein